MEKLLADLVLLPSTSEDDIKPLVEFICARMDRLGLEPRIHGDAQRPALIFESEKGGVMLSGHLDTVPHGVDWEFEDGETVDGQLYGRGACDMKGGCAAMLLAAEELRAAGVPFTLCFTTDEETTMKGAMAAAEDEAVKRAPAVLVAEPSDFKIIVKEKGQLQLSVVTKGVPAHASMPQTGENAIEKMVSLLDKTKDMQKIPKQPLDELTMAVTTIRGGTRINVIPGGCEAEIDIRYPRPMTADSVISLLKKRMGYTGYELKVLHQLDPIETDANSRPIGVLKELLGPSAEVVSVPYATEMVMFRKSNSSLLVCGPGDTAMCHVDNERVSVADVKKATGLYREFCSRLAPE